MHGHYSTPRQGRLAEPWKTPPIQLCTVTGPVAVSPTAAIPPSSAGTSATSWAWSVGCTTTIAPRAQVGLVRRKVEPANDPGEARGGSCDTAGADPVAGRGPGFRNGKATYTMAPVGIRSPQITVPFGCVCVGRAQPATIRAATRAYAPRDLAVMVTSNRVRKTACRELRRRVSSEPADSVESRRSAVSESRGTVLLTGVGRRRSIGAGVAVGLAADGWDLALGYWAPYDTRLGLDRGQHDPDDVADECRALGRRVDLLPGDLALPDEPARLVAAAAARGDLKGLVMSHCESVDSATLDTTVESWDRHFAVNARASWLLIKAFAELLPDRPSTDVTGRIVALTSDHTAHNLPYGASKGALDRLVIAAAVELGPRGVRANVINPGPVDTGWMTPAIHASGTEHTPAGRLGTPRDIADLIRFLMSDAGGWITGQLLYSNGGFKTSC
jgi:3-oxoacyl-[acyl-carrier protein] reductase